MNPPQAIPFARVLAYSSPVLAVSFIGSLSSTYFVKFGTDVLLVAPSTIAMIYGASRLWEAICDPLVGFGSDGTRHRLGRRRSWILASALPMCAFLMMLWIPPASLSGTSMVVWLTVAAFGLATSLSAFAIPHAALGAETSMKSHDRTRLFATNGIMGALASFAALTLGMGYLRTAQEPRQAAIKLFALVSCAVLILIVTMVLRSREPAHHQGRGGQSPWRAYRDVLRNPHARTLIVASLFIHMTYGAMGTVAVYMLQYVMKVPESTELFMASYFIPTLASVPLWVHLTSRFEKRHLWMVCLAGSGTIYLGLGLTPENTPLSIALPLGAAMGFFGGGFFVFEPAIRAEVIDFDEHQTGERKEGVYSAASQLMGKAAAAGMTVLVGVAIDWAGYVPNAEQSDLVKSVIRTLFGFVPAACFFTALILLFNFKLSAEIHGRIRAELDARHDPADDAGRD